MSTTATTRHWVELPSPWPELIAWVERTTTGRVAQASAVVEELDRTEAQEVIGTSVDQYPEADSQLEQLVSLHTADCGADLARLFCRRIRRQIDLIEPGMRDVRSFCVQPIDWSAIPTT